MIFQISEFLEHVSLDLSRRVVMIIFYCIFVVTVRISIFYAILYIFIIRIRVKIHIIQSIMQYIPRRKKKKKLPVTRRIKVASAIKVF